MGVKRNPPSERSSRKRSAIRYSTSNYLRTTVHDVKIANSPSLLPFFIPHRYDEDKDGSYRRLEYAEERATDCQTCEVADGCVAHQDHTPEHNVGAKVEAESRYALGDVLSREFCCEEADLVPVSNMLSR